MSGFRKTRSRYRISCVCSSNGGKYDTVRLSQAQMVELFGKNRTVIGRHVRNAIEDGEASPDIMSDIHNLDVIIG